MKLQAASIARMSVLSLLALTMATPAAAQTPPTDFVVRPDSWFRATFPKTSWTATDLNWKANFGFGQEKPGALFTANMLVDSYRRVAGLTGGGDPLANAFFPPELVMQHQQRINLTAEQRTAIIRAIQEAQPRFVEAQWQLEPETAALAEMVKGARVDQQRVLQQIDRILDIERRIKRSQIELLVAIKNQLTQEQQQELLRLGGSRGLMTVPRDP